MHFQGLLLLLFTGWVVGIIALVVYTIHSLTHPPRRSFAYAVSRQLPSTPAEIELTGRHAGTMLVFSEWTFISRGLTLPVWDVRGLDANGPTVILSHGWGDSRVVALTRLASLVKHASRVVLWDLPGHGDAPGTCSLGTREVDDLLALIQTVCADNPASLVLYGFSLGAGISIAAAADSRGSHVTHVKMVIAEAPYRVPITPAGNVLKLAGLPHLFNLPPAMLFLGLKFGHGASWTRQHAAGGFDRALHAQRLTVPLLVLQGAADQVCPIADGRAIAAAAPQGAMIEVADGGHLDLWTKPECAEQCESHVAAAFAGTCAIQA